MRGGWFSISSRGAAASSPGDQGEEASLAVLRRGGGKEEMKLSKRQENYKSFLPLRICTDADVCQSFPTSGPNSRWDREWGTVGAESIETRRPDRTGGNAPRLRHPWSMMRFEIGESRSVWWQVGKVVVSEVVCTMCLRDQSDRVG